ncbi:MAG: Butanoate coenzyme A-transferase [Anaerolineae bacterium]|nr:Butanoate coenzyme A-transferase [Anaerolineae bacterium]RIK33912.1 MAG: 4-hydroxybutyrate CoA-transferase [Chloroflexota bacterium]
MDFSALYKQKLMTPQDAVRGIASGSRIYLGGGAGIPQTLERALVERASELRGVEVVHVLTFAGGNYMAREHAASFRHRALFMGENARAAVREGRADFMPIFLSEIPGLFRDGPLPLDTALIQVSPPDEHGFCSFGIEVGVTKPAAQAAKRVIAEMNVQMPRVLGDSFIHLNKIDTIVETDYPLPIVGMGKFGAVQDRIGQHVAALIPDGATLQLGIGSIPDAVLFHLKGKRDLGIHTELFSDGVIDLVEQGVITNDKKTLHPGKMVAGFLFGSQRLYDFVHDNALIELHPTDYVNDPFIIAQNDNMIAINSALEVDLTGQVCADSVGPNFYSGIGGQVDFVRGAARARGGKPIIALPSTAKDDAISRIVPQLKPGAGVVTSRGDVHYVVTEYGVASLHGKSIRERAQALINIAHPKFRDELAAYARGLHWW